MAAHAHPHLRGEDVPAGLDRGPTKRALTIALALTATFTVVEIVGGLLTESLALLADAGHMLSDVLSLGVALVAVTLAERPSTPARTFGYQRAEILAALFNGVALVAISIWIFIEAAGRFSDPPEVLAGWVLVVACAGLAVNVFAARILHRAGGESLNVSAALRHVLADALASIGVIVAALVIVTTGWEYADPLVSVLIGLLILGGSWTVLRDSTRVLLEASPAGIDVEEVGEEMARVDGVVEVHDLHVWTITSGFPALAAHVLVGRDDDCHAKRREIERLLSARFGLAHTTLQVDHAGGELLQIEARPGASGAPEGYETPH
ncbi:MAG: cation diffusion facilitator family transporter [Solirubrobacterales bacterium]